MLIDELNELSDIEDEIAENISTSQHNDKSSLSDLNLGNIFVAQSYFLPRILMI